MKTKLIGDISWEALRLKVEKGSFKFMIRFKVSSEELDDLVKSLGYLSATKSPP